MSNGTESGARIKTAYQVATACLVWLALVCVIAYTIAAIFYVFSNFGWKWFSFVDHFFSLGDGRYMFGLPIAGVAAAAIVSIFEIVSPSSTEGNSLSFEAFGAKFSGPAAPATLWIVTYLALALSIVATVDHKTASMEDGAATTRSSQETKTP
jgi:hypothetical protein